MEALALAAGSIVGAQAGARLLARAEERKLSPSACSCSSWRRSWWSGGALGLFVLLVAFGAGAGMLAGLLGVGGGVLLVPFLVLVVGMTQHEAEATSLLVILPSPRRLLALRRRHVGDLPTALPWASSVPSERSPASCSRSRWTPTCCVVVFAALLAFVGVRLIGDARAVR